MNNISEILARNGLADVAFVGRRTQEKNCDVNVVVPLRVLETVAQLLELGGRDYDFERAQSDARDILAEMLR